MKTINADELKKRFNDGDLYFGEVVKKIIDSAPDEKPDAPEIPAEILAHVVEIIREILPQLVEIAKAQLKDRQPERNCEKCEHYKLKTEGVPGDGLYGCELWDCIYERGQNNAID